ncbi:Ras-related protein Rab-18 [Neolecta irregularis DAH-3]|uniref:Ras-related protein Rab-18 n=1 Tax=Neolecta irregularis (strain DAH-3) TaxID=1198029 RepID=A0A1U7LNG2_NEOID|nr:Ras-related protein Rab-18 [Neolecta irregularis DAH-3]|eukprot:OLL24168.1 Ras-related protein Rab-18 [Neolecta irregularis DAH-3]
MRADTHDIPTLKVLLVGNSNVGKTAIFERFVDDFYDPETTTATIGVDFRSKIVEVRDTKVKLNIWDTAGQERFRSLTSSYFRNALGALIVFDLSVYETFEQLPLWFRELRTYSSDQQVATVVVGAKLDKVGSRVVNRSEGMAMADKNGAGYIEVSAKTGVGVVEAFEMLIGRIMDTPALWKDGDVLARTDSVVAVDQVEEGTRYCGC